MASEVPKKILADHLSKLPVTPYRKLNSNRSVESNLGIVVDPAQVRLLPKLQDGYKWSVRPEMKHLLRKNLFKKQLSKHAVGAYMELYREVGESFDAVRLAASKQVM